MYYFIWGHVCVCMCIGVTDGTRASTSQRVVSIFDKRVELHPLVFDVYTGEAIVDDIILCMLT